MYKPIAYHKQKIEETVISGALTLGEKVVATEYSRYKIADNTNIIVEERESECARKIPFLQIRKKLMKKLELFAVSLTSTLPT